MRFFFFLLLLLFGARLEAGETRNKSNGTNWWDRHYTRHNYAISYPTVNGTTIYVRAKDYVDGALVANNASFGWIARSAGGVNSFNLNGITSTSTTFPYICDDPYGFASYERNKTRVFENRDTGQELGTFTDTWSFEYLPGVVHGSESVIYHDEVVTVEAMGNTCDDPRNDLSFYLALTVHPHIAGGWVQGNYVVTLEVDGATVYTATLPLNEQTPGPIIVNVAVTGVDTIHKYFSYSWKVDGSTVAGGSYACADEIPLNEIYDEGEHAPEYEPGEGEPEPEMVDSESETTDGSGNTTTTTNTNTTTNPGNSPSPPTNFTNQNVTSNVANGSASGDAITNQDIYNDVRQALIDAGKTGTYPEPQPMEEPGGDIITEETGDLEDIGEKLTSVTDGTDSVVSGMQGKIEGFASKLDNVPTELGSVAYIDLGTVTIAGNTVHLKLDFATGMFADKVVLIRQLLYWFCTILFIFTCVQTTRGYL